MTTDDPRSTSGDLVCPHEKRLRDCGICSGSDLRWALAARRREQARRESNASSQKRNP